MCIYPPSSYHSHEKVRFITVELIDGVFCLGRACDKQTRGVLTVTLDWSKIMGGYSTADTVVRDERTK